MQRQEAGKITKCFPGRVQLPVALLVCLMGLAWAANPEAENSDVQFIEARMGEFKVDYEDAYLCTAVPLPGEPLKLVGIEPLAKQEIAHHMLLFGEYGLSRRYVTSQRQPQM